VAWVEVTFTGWRSCHGLALVRQALQATSHHASRVRSKSAPKDAEHRPPHRDRAPQARGMHNFPVLPGNGLQPLPQAARSSLRRTHMTTHVVIGDEEWAVGGLWESTPKGWRLRASGIVGASPP
jgi:hypothetical protein